MLAVRVYSCVKYFHTLTFVHNCPMRAGFPGRTGFLSAIIWTYPGMDPKSVKSEI